MNKPPDPTPCTLPSQSTMRSSARLLLRRASPKLISSLHSCSVLDTRFAYTWPSIPHHADPSFSRLPFITCQLIVHLHLCRFGALITVVVTSKAQIDLTRRTMAITEIRKMTFSALRPIAVFVCIACTSIAQKVTIDESVAQARIQPALMVFLWLQANWCFLSRNEVIVPFVFKVFVLAHVLPLLRTTTSLPQIGDVFGSLSAFFWASLTYAWIHCTALFYELS